MIIDDCKNYQNAANNYDQLVATINGSREIALSTRDARQLLFHKKIEAAENVLMCVLGNDNASLMRVGLANLFNELSAGKHSPTILFQITEHICLYKLQKITE